MLIMCQGKEIITFGTILTALYMSLFSPLGWTLGLHQWLRKPDCWYSSWYRLHAHESWGHRSKMHSQHWWIVAVGWRNITCYYHNSYYDYYNSYYDYNNGICQFQNIIDLQDVAQILTWNACLTCSLQYFFFYLTTVNLHVYGALFFRRQKSKIGGAPYTQVQDILSPQNATF